MRVADVGPCSVINQWSRVLEYNKPGSRIGRGWSEIRTCVKSIRKQSIWQARWEHTHVFVEISLAPGSYWSV